MKDQMLSKEDQLIAFFVNQCSGRIGRTQIMKFLYLADYESRRYFGKSLSNIDYVWYHYGPYDKGLNERIDRLVAEGVVRSETQQFPTGHIGYRYSTGPKEIAYSLDADELLVLTYVSETYAEMPLRDLLDEVVYETEPMQHAQARGAKNESLDMSLVDGQKRFELGVPFEELLARSREAKVGKKVSLEELMHRITTSLTNAAAA